MAMAGIGLLVVIILHQSSTVMALYMETGQRSMPGSYWVVVAVSLSLCALIPNLLTAVPQRSRKKGLETKLICYNEFTTTH